MDVEKKKEVIAIALRSLKQKEYLFMLNMFIDFFIFILIKFFTQYY